MVRLRQTVRQCLLYLFVVQLFSNASSVSCSNTVPAAPRDPSRTPNEHYDGAAAHKNQAGARAILQAVTTQPGSLPSRSPPKMTSPTSSQASSPSSSRPSPKRSPPKSSPKASPRPSLLKSSPRPSSLKSSPRPSPLVLSSPRSSSPNKLSPRPSTPKSSPRPSPLIPSPRPSPSKSSSPRLSPLNSSPRPSSPKASPRPFSPKSSPRLSPPKSSPRPSPKTSPPKSSPNLSRPQLSPNQSPPRSSPGRSPSPRSSPKWSPSPRPSPATQLPKSPSRSPSPQRSPPRVNLVVRSPSPSPARSPRLPNKPRLSCQSSEPFYQGMNIPYENFSVPLNMLMYGNNFGLDHRTAQNYNPAFWESMFKQLSEAKGTVARLWLFGDGRGVEIWRKEGDFMLGLTAKFFADMDDMMARAAKYKIKVMPVLFSWALMHLKIGPRFNRWPQDVPRNRSFLVTDYAMTQQFMDRVLRPMVERYDGHPALHSWDCFNEPEQVTVGSATKGPEYFNASVADFQHWTALCAATVHMYSSSRATLGAWDVLFVCNNPAMGCYGNRWSDENLTTRGIPNRRDLWPYAYLDYYQAHFYRIHEYPIGRPACDWGIDKPLLVGETVNRTAQWGIEFGPTRVMEYTCRNGYQGVLFMGMATHQEGMTSKVPPRMWRDFQVTISNFEVGTCKSSLPWPDSGDNPPLGYTRDQGMTKSVRALYYSPVLASPRLPTLSNATSPTVSPSSNVSSSPAVSSPQLNASLPSPAIG